MAKKKEVGGRFRLLAGEHVEGTGEEREVYVKGDTVESDKDLEKKFVNKFERLADKEPAAVKSANKAKAVAEEDETEDEYDSDENSGGNKNLDPVGSNSSAKLTSKLGENVTDDFELAKEAGLSVFRKGKKSHFVVEPEDTNAPLNDEPLQSKQQVDSFVKKYIKG